MQSRVARTVTVPNPKNQKSIKIKYNSMGDFLYAEPGCIKCGHGKKANLWVGCMGMMPRQDVLN